MELSGVNPARRLPWVRATLIDIFHGLGPCEPYAMDSGSMDRTAFRPAGVPDPGAASRSATRSRDLWASLRPI